MTLKLYKRAMLLISGIIITLILLYRYAIYSPYRISSDEAKKLLQAGQIDLILDVRTQLERDTIGFYPNSVHIQSSDLERKIPPRFPDKTIRILTYCNTGQRARRATEALISLGYENARYISSSHMSLL